MTLLFFIWLFLFFFGHLDQGGGGFALFVWAVEPVAVALPAFAFVYSFWGGWNVLLGAFAALAPFLPFFLIPQLQLSYDVPRLFEGEPVGVLVSQPLRVGNPSFSFVCFMWIRGNTGIGSFLLVLPAPFLPLLLTIKIELPDEFLRVFIWQS